MKLDGAPRVMIVGDPISQVKSPARITADLPSLLAGLDRMRNLDAILVTAPHKFACYRHRTTATPRAHVLGAVSWHGEMLDGQGFVDAMSTHGGEIEGSIALPVGAGGAGSAVGLELLDRGAAESAVHDLDSGRRDRLLATLGRHYRGKVTAGSTDPRGFDIPIDVAGLWPTTIVGCVITAPVVSSLVAAARELGCPSSVGGDMFQAEQRLMLDFLQEAA